MNALFIFALFAFSFCFGSAYAESIKLSAEGGMDLEISYPEQVFPDRNFALSFFVKNNGWEDKEQVSLVAKEIPKEFSIIGDHAINVTRLSSTSTFGKGLEYKVGKDVLPGTYYINFDYSQIFVKNNQERQEPKTTNIAVPIKIKSVPSIQIHTKVPTSIFANAEFPFDVEVISSDIDLKDVTIEIVSPQDIEFRGETKHQFSSISKNIPVAISSRIITPEKEINAEYKIPFEVIVRYSDDMGIQNVESEVIQTILRPRSFMELTTDGGIWIGGFFLAPYVSIGTIVGIPAGTIFSLLIKKAQSRKKKRTRKSSQT